MGYVSPGKGSNVCVTFPSCGVSAPVNGVKGLNRTKMLLVSGGAKIAGCCRCNECSGRNGKIIEAFTIPGMGVKRSGGPALRSLGGALSVVSRRTKRTKEVRKTCVRDSGFGRVGGCTRSGVTRGTGSGEGRCSLEGGGYKAFTTSILGRSPSMGSGTPMVVSPEPGDVIGRCRSGFGSLGCSPGGERIGVR